MVDGDSQVVIGRGGALLKGGGQEKVFLSDIQGWFLLQYIDGFKVTKTSMVGGGVYDLDGVDEGFSCGWVVMLASVMSIYVTFLQVT